MIIFKRVQHLKDWTSKQKEEGKSTGFVPTMGALHRGHLSLAEISNENNDLTIASVFVNPKQFNDPEDLKKYPRPIESDISMLIESNVDVLFLPDLEDIYPPGLDTSIDFDPGPAANTMEGKFRPGHFKGMAEVVYRLLDIVEPDRLYMGQKDYQQLSIVRKMITDMHLPVILEMCQTIRESNGLAMSSRNTRLSTHARNEAAIIYSTLMAAQRLFEEDESIPQIKKIAFEALNRTNFEPEYFEIVDGISLDPVQSQSDSQFVVACCAVKVEGIRLIDNAIWTRSE
ncbi:MAG TPA: pantoate--beta-alanine ligase [Saprospiraceae bacterium]|nr:pantoate--beta-alanine ligase [Saprospiraceae bacterium]